MLVWMIGVVLFASAIDTSAQARGCYLIDPDLTNPELRDVVFEGILLGHRQEDGAKWSVFLVQRSWKGVRSDTVSVRTPEPTGVVGRRLPWPAGETYLVFGDLDGSQVVPRRCDEFLRLVGQEDRLTQLGEPRRVLTPESLERLRSDVIRPGARLRRGGGAGISVTLSVLGEYGVVWNADVELGDRQQSTDVFGRAQFDGLPGGLYEGRVTVGDATHAFHFLVGCVVERLRCQDVRGRIRTHPVVPGGTRELLVDDITFTPFSKEPRLLNHDEIERDVRAVLPDAEFVIQVGSERRDALSEFFLFVDEKGEVKRIHFTRSSARRDVDSAVVEAVKDARFSPAKNRDVAVPVWIRGYLVARR